MREKNATNHGFVCVACGVIVSPAPVTARNHCPACFMSLHVDATTPGDRGSMCGGVMRVVAIRSGRDGWSVTHACTRCHKQQSNRTAPDDDIDALIRISASLAARV